MKKRTQDFGTRTTDAADMLKHAKYAIVLTGAGISTDSGIPDFRSPKTGLWNQKDAHVLTEPGAFEKHLDFFWKVGYKIGKTLLKAKPNAGHLVIAKWMKQGLVKSITTQNVDGLHQKAGSEEDRIIELHGNAAETRCIFCRGYYSLKRVMALYKEAGRKPPNCIVCAAPLKPNVVLFGEGVPLNALRDAQAEAVKADVVLLIGSSSVVYPANYLPVMVAKNGGKVIIINNADTDLDKIASITIKGSISDVLQEIDKHLPD